MAYVAPVYKKDDRCSAKNHRPVTITSICSYVVEHIFFSNIMQHLDKNYVFMDAQHEFRKKHSYKTQLMTIIEDMACNLSFSTQINAIFLDFAKAFDIVPHQRLLLKLEYHCSG